MRVRLFAAALLFATAMTGVASAGFGAPEISASEMTSGLSLLAGGFLILRDSLRRR